MTEHPTNGVTRDEILAEIGRELALRRNVYRKWVAAGKLTPELSEMRIRCMQAGYDYLRDFMPKQATYFEDRERKA